MSLKAWYKKRTVERRTQRALKQWIKTGGARQSHCAA